MDDFDQQVKNIIALEIAIEEHKKLNDLKSVEICKEKRDKIINEIEDDECGCYLVLKSGWIHSPLILFGFSW